MKRLIVCADGTYGTPQRANVTNVVKMSDAILVKDSKGVDQKVIYDPGVGTNVPWWKKGLQGAFGYGLEENVKECYRSLMDNYVPHENAGVYLFGYSSLHGQESGWFHPKQWAAQAGTRGQVR